MNFTLLIYIFLAFILTFLSLQIFLNKFQNIFLDSPSFRSSHEKTTPTSGGATFVIVISFFFSLIGDLTALISLPLATVGLMDDKLKINSFVRYLVHIFTAISILGLYEKLNFNDFQSSFITIFLIVLGTGFINIINFMDGLDGLISSTLIFLFLFLSILSSPNYLILVFSLLAFLIYNWHPSKVFMGDVGSTFLGALIFGAILKVDNIMISFSILVMVSPLLMDSFICIIRRFFNRQNIFKPHKLHLYQRLYQGGLSHSEISILYSSNVIFLGLICLYSNISLILLGMSLVLFFGIFLECKFALPFRQSLRETTLKKIQK